MAPLTNPDFPQRKGSSPLGVALLAFLLILTVGYRIAASHYAFLGNTAPLMAVAFGGALLLGARFWWVPVVLLVVSDLFLGIWHGGGGIGGYTLLSIGFYLGVAFLGGRLGGGSHPLLTLWCGTLCCSLLFYVVANTYSWGMWPGYEKSVAGWLQSQTTGVPGVQPPAWMFLRNALIADSVWCAIAAILFWIERRSFPAPVETAESARIS